MSDRLGVVMRLRRLRERSARVDLAEVQARATKAREFLDSLQQPVFDGGRELGVEHLVALRAQGVVQAEQLDLARDELERTRAEVNEAMAVVQGATSRRRSAELLDERRRLARAAVAARAAQAALDEAVLMRRAWIDSREDDDE